MMSPTTRTSLTDPIKVFWIDQAAHGQTGRLGLTFAPGKKAPAQAVGGVWDRDVRLDLDRLREHFRTDVLVSLMEDFEYVALGIDDLFAEASARGIEVIRFPIVDTSTPTPEELLAVRTLVMSVREHLTTGHNVVIHCRGGLGRTGTVAALVVSSYGHATREAIRIVREVQPGAVENSRQERYVEATAKLLS